MAKTEIKITLKDGKVESISGDIDKKMYLRDRREVILQLMEHVAEGYNDVEKSFLFYSIGDEADVMSEELTIEHADNNSKEDMMADIEDLEDLLVDEEAKGDPRLKKKLKKAVSRLTDKWFD